MGTGSVSPFLMFSGALSGECANLSRVVLRIVLTACTLYGVALLEAMLWMQHYYFIPVAGRWTSPMNILATDSHPQKEQKEATASGRKCVSHVEAGSHIVCPTNTLLARAPHTHVCLGSQCRHTQSHSLPANSHFTKSTAIESRLLQINLDR